MENWINKMLLSLEELSSIRCVHSNYNPTIHQDIVTIFYNSWYKPRWTLKFNRFPTEIPKETQHTAWVMNRECEQLLAQINAYLYAKYELLYFTRDQFLEILNFTLYNSKDIFESFDQYIEFLKKYHQPGEDNSIGDNIIPFKKK